MTDWTTRVARLADELERAGELRTPAWRAAVCAVPRHELVPRFYEPDGAWGWQLVDGGNPAQREQWLTAVYSDRTLVTALVDMPLPEELGGGVQRVAVSSTTVPSLMVRMLEDLDVEDGHTVLEVGTGTGYNAALLSARLGDSQVVSVELRPDLVASDTARLAAIGRQPRLVVGDGAQGYEALAPYDRIIATCSTAYVPPAWIRQLRVGGMMIVDIEGAMAAGNLAALWRSGDAPVVQGRFFTRWASFMGMAHELGVDIGRAGTADVADLVERLTTTGPAVLHELQMAAFLVQLSLPAGTSLRRSGDGNDTRTRIVAPDGSAAEVADRPIDDNGRYRVVETGPDRLWQRVEDAAALWRRLGSPGWERFGLTAAPDRQYVWLDHPGSPHTWPLDLAGDP